MTLSDFITKYTGKYVEYHSYNPAAKNQCTDLANAYIDEVLGLPAIIGTNAQDFPSKRGTNFDWIVNTPTGLPSKGDLMIFKSADKVGHISIFIEGNLSTFRSFDQNYPTGSACKIVSHNYKNVLGWMRAKKGSMATVQVDSKVFEELVSKSSKFDEIVKAGFVFKIDHDSEVKALKKALAEKPKEIIKEVPVTVIKEVIKEVPVTVIKEVIKEVPKIVEVIKEVPVEVIKVVTIDAPKVQLGGLQLLTLALKAMIAGKW